MSVNLDYFSSFENKPTFGGLLKWWYPQIIHFNRAIHFGVPLFLETPMSIHPCLSLTLGSKGGSHPVVLPQQKTQQSSRPWPGKWSTRFWFSHETLGTIDLQATNVYLPGTSRKSKVSYPLFFYRNSRK